MSRNRGVIKITTDALSKILGLYNCEIIGVKMDAQEELELLITGTESMFIRRIAEGILPPAVGRITTNDVTELYINKFLDCKPERYVKVDIVHSDDYLKVSLNDLKEGTY